MWKESPMHVALKKNRLGLLCFLNILGEFWSTENSEEIPVLYVLLKKMEDEDLNLDEKSYFVRYWISNATDQYGQSLVHIATRNGMRKSVKLLTRNLADVNVRKLEDGTTPLHFAAQFGQEDCARALLDGNADVNARDFVLCTPVHVAAQYGHVECLKLLLDQVSISSTFYVQLLCP